jgi:DNA-binding transcriptional regulator YiaG
MKKIDISKKQGTELVTQSEFAICLGISRMTVRKWTRLGKLPRPVITNPPRWTAEQIRKALATSGK